MFEDFFHRRVQPVIAPLTAVPTVVDRVKRKAVRSHKVHVHVARAMFVTHVIYVVVLLKEGISLLAIVEISASLIVIVEHIIGDDKKPEGLTESGEETFQHAVEQSAELVDAA